MTQADGRTVLEWVLAGQPVPAPPVVKMAIVESYLRSYGIHQFIETGTYLGDTTASIASLGAFVTTIELSETLHAKALERFSAQKNVRCLQGDSAQVLSSVLDNLMQPAVLWLDGHYSAGITARGKDKETPIVEELLAVYRARKLPHVVLVDDARCFSTNPLPDYPKLEDFEAFVRVILPDHSFEVKHDVIRILPKKS